MNIAKPFNVSSLMLEPNDCNIAIREEKPSDGQAIRDVILSAFQNHPHHAPGSAPIEHRIVEALRAAGTLSLSLVAVHHETIVGHIAFSPVRINDQTANWLGLGPVAVHPRKQRLGIGTAIINRGLELAADKCVDGVVVLGNPDYYQRFGFVVDPNLVLENVPAECFLARRFTRSEASGVITYHQAFSISEHDGGD